MIYPHSFESVARFTLLAAGAIVLSSVRGETPRPVAYSMMQFIAAEDSPAVAIEKAVKFLPRANQSAWMRLERIFFLHFDPNTFRGVEWGDSRKSPAIFNPSSLDANQWVSAVTEAGGKPTTQ